MRSIWKGNVSFGLVSIGVKLYSATEEKDVSFHQVRRSDGSRIRYKRVAEADGSEVSYGDIAKGYQLPSGETIVLTDDDFADLPLPSARVVDVLQFVPTDQIDPIYFNKSYYLEPEKGAVKPYVLLRDALQDSETAGLVKVALRNREQLATLRVRDGVIVLDTMIWPDEVREPDFGFLDDDVQVRPQEAQMARALVESMTGDFEPEHYTDDYRQALEQVIEAKIEGREVVEPEAAQPTAGTVVDLMSALRASVDAAKAGRASATPAADADSASTIVPDSLAPAPAAAKSTAAKRTATKTTAAKATARKAASTTPAPGKPAAKTAAVTTTGKTAGSGPSKTAAVAAKKAPAKKAVRKTA